MNKNLQTTPDKILEDMSLTFKQRNSLYRDNYKMVGPIMKNFFPNGVPAELIGSDQFHLFELMVVKMSRYAISNFTHPDSIHDAGVYAAMCESITLNENLKNG